MHTSLLDDEKVNDETKDQFRDITLQLLEETKDSEDVTISRKEYFKLRAELESFRTLFMNMKRAVEFQGLIPEDYIPEEDCFVAIHNLKKEVYPIYTKNLEKLRDLECAEGDN
jgi:hypothetical protein